MRCAAKLLFCLLLLPLPSRADTLAVVAAGSLESAFSDLLRRFPAGPDQLAPTVFGPSGLMRERIAGGLAADLFASADMAQPRALALGHPERLVINFTRNSLCAVARGAIGLTPANMLERLLDPSVRLATSTPGADPGGGYAWAMFARAEAVKPGAKAALEAKALMLVGGGDKTPPLVPGKGAMEGVFLADKADVMLGYCSGAPPLLAAVPGLVSVALPPELAVGAVYGMVLLNGKTATLRLAAFVMSETGQAVLRAHGFDAVGLGSAETAPPPLVVGRDGAAARLLDAARLGGLAAMTQTVALEHGGEATWRGPSLWDVLADAGAVDAKKPAEAVRLVVRVTGADGYVAAFALGEVSPEFAGKPLELALERDGKALALPRLVVPGEKRAGRSVRDVVRIEVQ
jgi:ABC-type molybdate transport system substrate-binding protein